MTDKLSEKLTASDRQKLFGALDRVDAEIRELERQIAELGRDAAPVPPPVAVFRVTGFRAPQCRRHHRR